MPRSFGFQMPIVNGPDPTGTNCIAAAPIWSKAFLLSSLTVVSLMSNSLIGMPQKMSVIIGHFTVYSSGALHSPKVAPSCAPIAAPRLGLTTAFCLLIFQATSAALMYPKSFPTKPSMLGVFTLRSSRIVRVSSLPASFMLHALAACGAKGSVPSWTRRWSK